MESERMAVEESFDVGGVRLARPFRIRRLGHFGFNSDHPNESLAFYRDLLGFRVSDMVDWRDFTDTPAIFDGLGDTRGYFMRYGGDHHAFVLFNRRVREAADRDGRFRAGVTVNQLTWQVGSLDEVVRASEHLRDHGITMSRSGRDTPGSNWHTYFIDPDGHTIELYYGIEQIGWNGRSKPKAMYNRGFRTAPPLPQIPEEEEVRDAERAGVALDSGYVAEPGPAGERFAVEGVLLPRPFAIVGIGPVRLFVADVERALDFYRDALGFTLTERRDVLGLPALFFRAGDEHHSLALYDVRLRDRLPVRRDTSSLSFGIRVASYRQLRAAAAFLADRGCRRIDLPSEIAPGIRHCVHFADPDGHIVQLHFEMERIGWDGRARSPALLPDTDPDTWPEVTTPLPESFVAEAYPGPWL